MGQLAALTTLFLNHCISLTGLPESVGQLAALTTLNLSRCSSLTGLPESMGQLITLWTLDLSGCESLTGLPESMGQLTALRELTVFLCPAFPRGWNYHLLAANWRLFQFRRCELLLAMVGRRRRLLGRYWLPPELWSCIDQMLWQSQRERRFDLS